MWSISIHSDFDSLGGPLSPCGSHWLRLEPFTQIRSRTLCFWFNLDFLRNSDSSSTNLTFCSSFFLENLSEIKE